ncbi:hypothetical protein GCM10027565_30980 [Bordetella tumulicola]
MPHTTDAYTLNLDVPRISRALDIGHHEGGIDRRIHRVTCQGKKVENIYALKYVKAAIITEKTAGGQGKPSWQ